MNTVAEADRRGTCPVVDGAAVPFDVVDSPGAYVCNWSGHLLRMPRHAVRLGRPPVLNIIGRAPLTVTKISDDPDVELEEAKRLAAQFRLDTNF